MIKNLFEEKENGENCIKDEVKLIQNSSFWALFRALFVETLLGVHFARFPVIKVYLSKIDGFLSVNICYDCRY